MLYLVKGRGSSLQDWSHRHKTKRSNVNEFLKLQLLSYIIICIFYREISSIHIFLTANADRRAVSFTLAE